MITPAQFDPLFGRLCASFGTIKQDKTRTAWYEEFKNCDFFTFCRTIKILRLGDRFPNWGMIWDTYRPLLPPELQAQDRPGCEKCENGRIFFNDYVLIQKDKPGGPRTLSNGVVCNCEDCSKDAINDIANIKMDNLKQIRESEYWTDRALKAHPEEEKKIKKDKLKRRKKWEKEKLSRFRITKKLDNLWGAQEGL